MNDGTVSSGDLGIFLIEGIQRTSLDAKVTLTSFATKLIERDASVIKDGLGWYANKPVGYLVEKLLIDEFANSSG